MRRAIEEGLVDAAHSIEVGLRGQLYDSGDWTSLSDELGLDYIPCRELMREDLETVCARIRNRVGDAEAFISFDIDVVDPAFAPGTGTPEAGGLSSYQALELIRGLYGINFIGFDVVEVIPAYDPGGVTATLAANLAFEMLSLAAIRRREQP
jgi:agmatinase